MSYLNPGLPAPVAAGDGLDRPFFEGLERDELFIQRCTACRGWQWGPEWICHHCHSFDLTFEQVAPSGTIFSYERVWHPVHPALQDQGPYLVVLVELSQAEGVRMVGNLLGDPRQEVAIGSAAMGVFEHNTESEPGFSLLHWRCVDPTDEGGR